MNPKNPVKKDGIFEKIPKNYSVNMFDFRTADELCIHDDKSGKLVIRKIINTNFKSYASLQQKKEAVIAKYEDIRRKNEFQQAKLIDMNKQRQTNIFLIQSQLKKFEKTWSKISEEYNVRIGKYQALVQRSMAAKAIEEQNLEILMSPLNENIGSLLNQRDKLEEKIISCQDDGKSSDSNYRAYCNRVYDRAFRNLRGMAPSGGEKSGKQLAAIEINTENIEELQQDDKSFKSLLKKRLKQYKELERKIPGTMTDIYSAQDKLYDLQIDEAERSWRLEQMQEQYKQQESAMITNRPTDLVLHSLMWEKAAGRLPGVFGRLKNLGEIDLKYSTAMTAASDAMDFIVVDTVETVRACFKFLTCKNIGCAKLIALEELEEFVDVCEEEIQTPENVPRLLDLIKGIDELIRPAFNYALQNTLLADGLEQAMRVAYGSSDNNWRVVTLNGEVLDPLGETGDNGKSVPCRKVGKKARKKKITAEDLKILKREMDKMSAERLRVIKDQQVVEAEIKKLSAKLDEENYRRDQALFLLQLVDDLNRFEELPYEAQVAQINVEIDEICGEEVLEIRKKICALAEIIEEANSEIFKLQQLINTVEKDVQSVKLKIETLNEDVLRCEQNIASIQRETVAIAKDEHDFLKEMEEISAEKFKGRITVCPGVTNTISSDLMIDVLMKSSIKRLPDSSDPLLEVAYCSRSIDSGQNVRAYRRADLYRLIQCYQGWLLDILSTGDSIKPCEKLILPEINLFSVR